MLCANLESLEEVAWRALANDQALKAANGAR